MVAFTLDYLCRVDVSYGILLDLFVPLFPSVMFNFLGLLLY
jgi:hypothetical protein